MTENVLADSIERVPVGAVTPYPGNPRRGDVAAIVESLTRNGMYRPVVVQRSTGYVLAGNHTLLAARQLGWPEIAVSYIDVDDAVAARIVLADNKIGELGTYDEVDLGALLLSLDDVSGTGYDTTEAERLIAAYLSAPADTPASTLTERFGVPPFTVLDTRTAYWRARAAAWSEVGAFSMDPVAAEMGVLWFSAVGARVLDPFPDGPGVGMVVARSGRHYVGVGEPGPAPSDPPAPPGRSVLGGSLAYEPAVPLPPLDALTPVEWHGGFPVKRDDAFDLDGNRGGKVRTCLSLALEAGEGLRGLVTGGASQSPQVNIVASVARRLGVPARCWVPKVNELSPELAAAAAAGAELVQVPAGYSSVLNRRSADDAAERGWTLIPFGMETPRAVELTARQVANLPAEAQRIVMPAGSGMSLAGVLHGLDEIGRPEVPVLAVQVGGKVEGRLDRHAPPNWRERVTLVVPDLPYHEHASDCALGGVLLDPVYEAKCLPYLEPGDLLWVVGRRQTAAALPSGAGSSVVASDVPGGFDLLLTAVPSPEVPGWQERLTAAARRLAEAACAVVVVSEGRADGWAVDRPAEVVRLMDEAGLRFYNDGMLIHREQPTAVPSFPVDRALAPAHSQLLVFLRGSPVGIGERLGVVAFGSPEEALAEEEPPPETV